MMTRDEALEIIKEHMDRHEVGDFYSVSPAYLLMMLQRLGMLKLDEPKSAKDVLKDCVVSVDKYLSESHTGILDKYGVDAILQTIEGAGFKIVEK